jgi:CO/xanthine dehydrogenase FAD-binding subunit
MIVAYHHPTSLEEALALLARKQPRTVPLAGGSALNRPSPEQLAAVDLQELGLSQVDASGKLLKIGATTTLQTLLSHLDRIPALKEVVLREANYNLRQVASLAGTLVAADGRSPLATAFLALDATLELLPGQDPEHPTQDPEEIALGDLLPLRSERLPGRLITQISIPLNVELAYEYVARTPADLPLVCVAVVVWPSGRTRLALGGYGKAPALAFDGSEGEGVETAARSAYSQAQDAWATAEYRREVAAVLAGRCLQSLRPAEEPTSQ